MDYYSFIFCFSLMLINCCFLFLCRQYFWHDEKGKKFKCTAPEYVDYVMSFIQKDILEESVFPTKFGKFFKMELHKSFNIRFK